MWIAIFIATTILATIKWWVARLRFKALLYYIVDKGYTAPTKMELERCISVVTEKTVEEFFRK